MFNAIQESRLRLQAQLVLERICPATVKIGDAEYVGATRGLGVANTLSENGFTYIYDIVFRVRKTLLSNAPEIGSTLIWNEKEFRVQKVPDRPTDPAWYIGCEDLNK